jgi:hypothetical protein
MPRYVNNFRQFGEPIMYRILAVCCVLFLASGMASAQTIDSKSERINLRPGSYGWTLDNQVIIAMMGVTDEGERWEDWVRDLNPDFNDWTSYLRAEEPLRYGILTSASNSMWNQQYLTDKILAQKLRPGLGVRLDGALAEGANPWGPLYNMCHNNAIWHDYKKQNIMEFAPKVGAINQDNIAGVWSSGMGFCDGCQRVFRTFLQTRYTPDTLRQMGIRNVEKFHILDYLRKKKTGNALSNDPVVRAYILAVNLNQRDLWKDVVDSVHQLEPGLNRPIPLTGNQQGGDEWEHPYNLLLSEINDIVSFESDPWFDGFEYPRDRTAGVKFKLADASGRYRKAVWVRGGLYDRKRKDTQGKSYRMRLYGDVFQDLAHGEAFANGGVRVFNLANEGAPLPEPPYETRRGFYNRFVQYADMVHSHRAAFQDRENAAEIALVYSMPTHFYEHFPSMNLRSDNFFPRYAGWARLLEESHLPYEVIIFGHSELFPDGNVLNRLSRYRTIILPGVTNMTKAQAAAVRQYVDQGGSVIWSGDLATHDENRTPWPEPLLKGFPRLDRRHIGKGRVVGIIDEDRDFRASIQARERPNPTDFHVMKEAAMWALDGRPQVVSTANPETQFNLWMAENKRSAGLHLVNYKIDIMRNYVETQHNVRVSVTLPDALEPIDRITLVAPGEPDIVLPFQLRGNALSLLIPELRVWAMVVLSSGQEQEAASTLANVRNQIRKHVVMGRDTGDWIAQYEEAFALYAGKNYNAALQNGKALLVDVTPQIDSTGR